MTNLSPCVLASSTVLHALKMQANKSSTGEVTMRYGDFARAIGLRGENEPWQARHRTLVTKVLRLTALCDETLEELDFSRIVGEDGMPGSGHYRATKMTVVD